MKEPFFDLPNAGDGRHIVAAILSQTICQLVAAGKTPAEAAKQAVDTYNAVLGNDPKKSMKIWDSLGYK